MRTRNDRDFYYQIQDPIKTPDNFTERKIYTALRDNYLLPIMQHKVGPYYLDFAFPDHKIAIEFNGPMHEEEKDKKRLRYLIKNGWNVYIIEPVPRYRIRNEKFNQIINGLEESVDKVSELLKEKWGKK